MRELLQIDLAARGRRSWLGIVTGGRQCDSTRKADRMREGKDT